MHSRMIDLMIMSLPLPLPGSRIYSVGPWAVHIRFSVCVCARRRDREGDFLKETRGTLFLGLSCALRAVTNFMYYCFCVFACLSSKYP